MEVQRQMRLECVDQRELRNLATRPPDARLYL